MATRPIGGTAAPVTFPHIIPTMPAVARILARYDRPALEAFIAIAIDLADTLDGDPEAEEPGLEDSSVTHDTDGPGCPIADARGDVAWIEWTAMRGSMKRGPNVIAGEEDCEESDDDTSVEDDPHGFDPEQDMCGAADDWIASGSCGAYVALPDSGAGDPDDAETWKATSNVPMDDVWSADHNPFTDARVNLGKSNLQSSFITGNEGVRSVDSGALYKHFHDFNDREPGRPV